MAYAKLLLWNLGDKNVMNDFGGENLNSDMYWKIVYDNMVLEKTFEVTSNGIFV